jgi:hypothetical protein
MQVYAIVEGTRRDAHLHEDGTFKCFPKCSSLMKDAKAFRDLRVAAAFLVQNPKWGIRMDPGFAIIYEDILIARR